MRFASRDRDLARSSPIDFVLTCSRILRCAIAACVLFASAGHCQLSAQDIPPSRAPEAQPFTRFELSRFGYSVPSRIDRLTEDEPNVSLNFMDADHLLLTFDRKSLFQRLATCSPDHRDRLMHAVVLDIRTGAAVKETDWYLHDRRRYLWPFGAGKLLLRRLNDLYVVDADLHERLLMSSPKDLLWVAVTPDASQIIVETVAEPSPPPGASSTTPAASAKPKYVAQFLDAGTLSREQTIPLTQVVNLIGTRWGYADLIHKGDVWLLRFGPNPTQRRNIARVRSRTVPSIIYSSDNSLLVGRCPSVGCEHSVTSLSLSGRRLWRQHWPEYHLFPTVSHTADGSRFGVSTLRIVRDMESSNSAAHAEPDPFQPELSQLDAFQQQVQVIDTATGDAVFTAALRPAMVTGQNFALTPNGRILAALDGTMLEMFQLAPPSSQQQTEFATLKSDIPNLYALASPDSAETLQLSATAPSAEVDHEDSGSKENQENAIGQGSATATNQSPAMSQQPASPEPETEATEAPVTTFKVTTKAVVIDVVVTDSKGQPVHGLHQQDFQLAEDGKTQDIHYFREFDDTFSAASDPSQAKSSDSATPADAHKAAANSFSNQTQAPAAGAVTLILFDLLNTPQQDQVFARQQLIKFLQSKPPNAQLALCTLSAGNSHLRLIQGFTSDENLLLTAAKGKKSASQVAGWNASAAGVANASETVGQLAQGGPMSGFAGLLGALQRLQAEQQGTDTDQRVAITMDSLMMLSRYLTGIPGRKNIVWLSGSFPISLPSTFSGDASLGNRNYSSWIKRVTNLLAEAQVAVYPVDVRGLLGGGVTAGLAGGMGGPTSIDPPATNAASVIAPSAAISSSQQAFALEAAERQSLLNVAAATGGKAFFNSNGIDSAIETAVKQGSNYYTLSYSPANQNYDGRFRKIRVALAEKGYTLRYRPGYFAESDVPSGAELARRARAVAMQHGSPQSRQLLFSATVVPVGPKKKVDRASLGEVLLASNKMPILPAKLEAQRYSIDYVLKASDLKFAARGNAGYRNTLILMITSYDSEGRMIGGRSTLGISELQASEYTQVLSREVSLHTEVDVPVEAVSLRLGIQDEMSTHIGTVEIALPISAPPNAPRRRTEPLPEIEPD